MKRINRTHTPWLWICTILYVWGCAQWPRESSDSDLSRGYDHHVQGQYDQAISDYNKAIELDPLLPEAYKNRAVAYFYEQEYEKAWQDVWKAQDLGFPVGDKFLYALCEASGLFGRP